MWTPGAVVRNLQKLNFKRMCIHFIWECLLYKEQCQWLHFGIQKKFKKQVCHKVKSAIKYNFELCLIFELNMYQSKVT